MSKRSQLTKYIVILCSVRFCCLWWWGTNCEWKQRKQKNIYRTRTTSNTLQLPGRVIKNSGRYKGVRARMHICTHSVPHLASTRSGGGNGAAHSAWNFYGDKPSAISGQVFCKLSGKKVRRSCFFVVDCVARVAAPIYTHIHTLSLSRLE